jgi:hypothetical protein
VVEETRDSLRAVGISYVLPQGELLIEAQLHLVNGSIDYQILVGIPDAAWDSLSESKRWKAVYAYATDAVEPSWEWDRPVIGTLEK